MGEARNFDGGSDWLAENAVEVVDLDDQRCIDLLGAYIEAHPEVWYEDIGED
jgi:cytosine deaminase